jgi:hypothetical protein
MFRKAIRKFIIYDSEVLVTGDPLGIISRLCAKEGAKIVYLYESLFHQIAKSNCKDISNIQVIRGDFHSHKTPVNTVVFYSGNYVSCAKTWEYLQKKEIITSKTRKIPSRIEISAEPVMYQDEFCSVDITSPINGSDLCMQNFCNPVTLYDSKTDSIFPKYKKFNCVCNDYGWVNGVKISFCEFVTDNMLVCDTEKTIKSIFTPVSAMEVNKDSELKINLHFNTDFSCFVEKSDIALSDS